MAVNGFEHSFQQIELVCDGRRSDMFKDVSYKTDVKKGVVKSAKGIIVGNTQGALETDGSITLLRSEFKKFRRWLVRGKTGVGFQQVLFDISVSYGEMDSLETDELLGCTINTVDVKNSEGTDALYISLPLSIQRIKYDGDEPITLPKRVRSA
jgi:hypothetical protein